MAEMIQAIDEQILAFIQENLQHGALDTLMVLFSTAADNALVWMFVALVLSYTKKYRPYGLILFVAVVTAFFLGDVLVKPFVGRVRPCDLNTAVELLIHPPGGFSFPSGHTASSFAAAALLFCANRKAGAAAALLAGCVAFSRLYLFVHYPSDILGGFVLGTAVGVFYYCLYQKAKGRGLLPDFLEEYRGE